MEDATALVDELLSQLVSLATERRREGMSRYFTTSMTCLGVSVPDLRKVARQMFPRLRRHSADSVLKCCHGLLATGFFEARQLAYEVVSRHGATMDSVGVREVEELGKGSDNWASTDAFAVLVTGELWLRRRLSDQTILKWARSNDVWWRRIAVVSSVPLNLKNRGGKGDVERTFKVVDIVKGDRHPMVAKGVSWALRSLVVWDPVSVRRYLDENESVLPALVRRETLRKLTTGRKSG